MRCSVFALFGILAIGLTFAAVCPSAPSTDVYAANACAGYKACEAKLCTCAGGNTTDAATCFSGVPSTTSCSAVTACLSSYYGCLTALSSARLNTSDSCSVFGAAVHQAQLSAAAGSYAGSSLQASCRYGLCKIMNVSSLTCTFGTDDNTVCMGAAVNTTTTAAATTTTTPSPTIPPAIVAQLRLGGSSWESVINDASKRAQLMTALTGDIATLLGIASLYITITGLSIGSLVVAFTVATGSGKTVSQLTSSVSAATVSTTWLTNVKAVYATVSSESVTVLSAGVTATGAPEPTSPVTTRASLDAASSVTVALALILAAVALVTM